MTDNQRTNRIAVGTATIDFGASPGTNAVSVDITAQPEILSDAHCKAWMMADSTVSGSVGHNIEEHKIVPIKLTCGNVVPGIGFTIYAVTDWRLTSTFQVRWSWE